jgi:hypothetical protein
MAAARRDPTTAQKDMRHDADLQDSEEKAMQTDTERRDADNRLTHVKWDSWRQALPCP